MSSACGAWERHGDGMSADQRLEQQGKLVRKAIDALGNLFLSHDDRVHRRNLHCDVLGERLKLRRTGDEVGLAVDSTRAPMRPAWMYDSIRPWWSHGSPSWRQKRCPARPERRLLCRCCTGSFQGALAVHDAAATALPQLLIISSVMSTYSSSSSCAFALRREWPVVYSAAVATGAEGAAARGSATGAASSSTALAPGVGSSGEAL